jgi:hypothetical protein
MNSYADEDGTIPAPVVIPQNIQAVANATIADDNVWLVV